MSVLAYGTAGATGGLFVGGPIGALVGGIGGIILGAITGGSAPDAAAAPVMANPGLTDTTGQGGDASGGGGYDDGSGGGYSDPGTPIPDAATPTSPGIVMNSAPTPVMVPTTQTTTGALAAQQGTAAQIKTNIAQVIHAMAQASPAGVNPIPVVSGDANGAATQAAILAQSGQTLLTASQDSANPKAQILAQATMTQLAQTPVAATVPIKSLNLGLQLRNDQIPVLSSGSSIDPAIAAAAAAQQNAINMQNAANAQAALQAQQAQQQAAALAQQQQAAALAAAQQQAAAVAAAQQAQAAAAALAAQQLAQQQAAQRALVGTAASHGAGTAVAKGLAASGSMKAVGAVVGASFMSKSASIVAK